MHIFCTVVKGRSGWMERIAICNAGWRCRGGCAARGGGTKPRGQPHFVLPSSLLWDLPVGATFWFQFFIQAPSPKTWRKTIFGGEGGCWRRSGGGLFWATSLKNYRRRDRDHLVPPRRMDAAVCRAEVCYPFGSELRETLAVKRRAFITLLVAATTHEDTGRKS